MNNHSLLPGIIRAFLFALLCSAAGSAFGTATFGTRVDNYCATQPTQATVPQQSRPYRASGSSCLICHTSANASSNNLNTLGNASSSCTSTTCSAAVNPFCVAHAPSGASITAPPTGMSVAQGQSLTFTAANATNPDGFPLIYTWLFTGGMPNAVGQSVAVPMTVAGSITSTLNVSNSVGMPATGTPPTRTVTVTTAALPALTVTPATLTFSAQAGGNAPAAQSLSVTSSGAQVSLSATASTSSGGNWLSIAPASSTTPSTLNVAVNQAGLAAGTYNGTLTITSSGASNSPRTVAVTLTVTAVALPTLAVAPASLTFAAQAGGAAPAVQTLSVTSSGALVSLSATASTTSGGNWLSVSPASSTTPSTLNVAVNQAGLAAGTYSGTVTITGAASNSPRTVAVTLTVTGAALPTLAVSPASLTIAAQAGGTAPAVQTLSVTSSGAQVDITATADTTSGGSWLSVTPASSTTPSTLNVAVNPAGLAAGTYSGTVTVAAGGVSNSPVTVAVTLTVTGGSVLPIANIVAPAINVSVLPGGKVTFRGSATDPANQPLTYRWTFPGGEPSTSSRQNPGAVRFRNPGTFTVTLTVTNRKGVASIPVTRVITVVAPNASPSLGKEECLDVEDHREHRDHADRRDREDHRDQGDNDSQSDNSDHVDVDVD